MRRKDFESICMAANKFSTSMKEVQSLSIIITDEIKKC